MKDFKIYITVATVLLVLYLVAQYNKPSPINWQSTLYYHDKIPYGTFILHNQLNQLFPGATVINTNQTLYQFFYQKNVSPGNYFIISNSVDLNSLDFKAMVDYIKAGNSVFISSFNWAGKLADTLKIQSQTEYTKNSAAVNFTNSRLKHTHNYVFDRNISNQYFSRFDTTHAVSLGENQQGKSNYLCFKYGKGGLYLFADPLILTNYSLLSGDGAKYAAKALSYLPVQPNIYWDELQNGDIADDQSPLRVFFNHPDLQWAYYISIFSLLTFVLYEMKRRQRIIPVMEPLKNATLDFVNVVGQVYYEQRNNQNIGEKKILYFLQHIRDKYYLRTNLLDSEFAGKLAQKTGINGSFAYNLINHINYVSVQKQVTDHELILLNQLIEQFYTQTE